MHLKVLEGSWILIFLYFLKDLKIPWKLQSVLEIPWISVLTLSNPKEKEQPQKYLQYKIAHEELLKKTWSFFCMHWMESLSPWVLESFSIFFNFAHPFLLLYLLYYLHLLFMFWAVIFMFHSVWWRFPRFELWLISWHSFSTLYVVTTARWFRFYEIVRSASTMIYGSICSI